MSRLLRTKDEIRSTDGDLPPWTIYQARCDWCPNRATYLVDAAAKPWVEGNSIMLGGFAGVTREVVCNRHLNERMLAVDDSHKQGSSGCPIRVSWRIWFTYDLPGIRSLYRWWNILDYEPLEQNGVGRLAAWRWGYLHVEWNENTGPWALEGVALTRRGAHRKLRRRNSSNITKGTHL
jgi:hypothetical protein